MTQTSATRKIYQGIADRQQMFRMFDRYVQRPNRWEGDDSHLFRGEWFEIARREHDYMFDVLPPLWMRGEMFAMREFLTGSITSVFYTLRINGHALADFEGEREGYRHRLADARRRLASYQSHDEKAEFAFAGELAEKRRQLAEIEKALAADAERPVEAIAA